MSEQDSPVPLLDLAPKLSRPLRLWWPPDYLRLLYWAFFFPQAIYWYTRKFGVQQYSAERSALRTFVKLLQNDPIQFRLLIQSMLLGVPILIASVLPIQFSETGAKILGNFIFFLLLVTILGSIVGYAQSKIPGAVVSLIIGVGGFWLVFPPLLVLGIILRVWFTQVIPVSVVVGIWFGGWIGLTGGSVFGVKGGLIIRGLFIIPFGIALGFVFMLMGAFSEVTTDVQWGVVGAAAAVGAIATGGRLLDYVVTAIPVGLWWRFAHSDKFRLSRVVWLPLPTVQWRLADWIKQDSARGVCNLNAVLEYTQQFIPVMRAVDSWFSTLSPEAQLVAADQLSRWPYDWNLVRFGSASLRAAMWQTAMSFMPKRYLKHAACFNDEPRLDTPARATCAGYWYLHITETDKAQSAFERIRHLPYGEVLYQSATALACAQQVEHLKAAAAWVDKTRWLPVLKEELLRPKTIATLQRLRGVALEAQVAVESISKLNRSAALGRAVSTLTEMIEDVKDTCPDPEWPIVKQIAEQWRDILSKAAGEIGQVAITKPVTNPYVVGNPVTDKVFVGREEVFQRLEELWGTDASQRVPSIVLYGHRRMGKTSILQNLGHRFGVNTIIAYLTMQRVGRVANTGELLTAFALALYDALTSAGIMTLSEPQSADFAGNGYAAFERFVVAARRAIGARRVILTVDEFELVEKAINEQRVDAEVLDYLRGVIHSEPWLVLALAGLHTLQEMTANYWNPLFASVTPVKVSFLTPGASAQLLANPADDFPLDFTQETADRVYAWVCGQPYLTQLVGHTLVRRYNQIVFEEGTARSSRFTPDDVNAVVDSPEFYEQGSYYFTGVWQQAEESGPHGQIALMRALAVADEPQGPAALFEHAGLDDADGQASLEKLLKHDVVRHADSTVDFAVPLMRKWLRMKQ